MLTSLHFQDTIGVIVLTALVSYLFFDGFLNVTCKGFYTRLFFHSNNIAIMSLLATLGFSDLLGLVAAETMGVMGFYLLLLSVLPIFIAIVYAFTLEPPSLHLLYERCRQEINYLNWGVKLEMVIILSATLCLASGLSQVETFRDWFGYFSLGHMLVTYLGLLGIVAFVVQAFFNQVMLIVRSTLAVSFFYPVIHVMSL
ncbi:hypothetical protein ACMXYX_14185 [Neptuniibacter sp. QD72_48]|uniref:hypothetical protein n=1 Tax=unclassified Neptuniibacter TaxID=2630693 RepID=UPI0039F687B1